MAERHQVLDQIVHPPCLALDDADEPLAGAELKRTRVLGQGFGITNDRGQGRAQLVAGVGDKISMRAADVCFGRAVGQLDCPARIIDPPPGELPQAAPAGEIGDGHAGAVGQIEQPHGFGMAQRDPRVLPGDMLAQRRARRRIGHDDPVPFEQQQRLFERLNRLTHRIARNPLGVEWFCYRDRFGQSEPQ